MDFGLGSRFFKNHSWLLEHSLLKLACFFLQWFKGQNCSHTFLKSDKFLDLLILVISNSVDQALSLSILVANGSSGDTLVY